jgi:hypothetical protein
MGVFLKLRFNEHSIAINTVVFKLNELLSPLWWLMTISDWFALRRYFEESR